MKLLTTSSKRGLAPADPPGVLASWPLPESALAYFPNARSANSGRDLDAGAPLHFGAGTPLLLEVAAMPQARDDHPHVPVLLERCVELLTPALTRHHADGSGAVLV